jgi:hypothetical protein
MDDRGVTGPVGVILILGISLLAITSIVAVGATLVDDARNDAETAQMENAMSQLSSKASLVALGDSSNQQFSLGRAASGDVFVQEDAGRAKIYIEDQDGSRDEIYNETYGAVVYRSGNTEVAYQGGGVWRKQGDSSRMVSPPEFHYRALTLTFPILRVDGSAAVSGQPRGTISQATVDDPIYPDPDNASRNNPLQDGSVLVEIQSRYCEGWEAFFDDRTDGTLDQRCDEADPQTVVVDLTVPFDLSFENSIAANTITVNGNDDPPENSTEGVSYPSASDEVDDQIDDCESGGCSTLDPTTDKTAGTYYTDSDVEFGDIELDTSSGDITMVIDGDITGADNITVTGDNNVTVYLKGDFAMGGGDRINTGGDATQFVTIVHSSADELDFNGEFQYTGGIYAPNTDADMNGAGSPDKNYVGSLIADDVDINGNPNNFEYDPNFDTYTLPIPSDVSPVTYLHVTENTIEVDLD